MSTGFRTTVLGWDAKQVDETIARMKREHEEILAGKDERFVDLRDRCNRLQEQLERYERQERSIASAVIDAHNKAAEILQNAQDDADRLLEHARAQAEELRARAREEYHRLERFTLDAEEPLRALREVLRKSQEDGADVQTQQLGA